MAAQPEHAAIFAQWLLHVERFMESRGLDYRRALHNIGTRPSVADDPDAFIPLRSLVELLENLARDLKNDAVGLQLGEAFPVGPAGALDYAVANSPTLRVAIKNLVRYLRLVATGYETRFIEGARISYITLELPNALAPCTQFVDAALALRAVRIRRILRDPSIPIRVDLKRPVPQSLDEFKRVLGRHVRFGRPADRIGVETRDLDRALPEADPRFYSLVERLAEQALAEKQRTGDVIDRLRRLIAEGLTQGNICLAACANELGLSGRALQRQLHKTNTSFRQLTEETRKAMARRYLLHTAVPLTEIAFLLGFSELSAFSRAAKLWFGTSPRNLRSHFTNALERTMSRPN